MKRQQIPQKLVYEKFYVHKSFNKNLLPVKCNENM